MNRISVATFALIFTTYTALAQVGGPPPPGGGGTNILGNPPPSGGDTNILGNPPPPPPGGGGTNTVSNPPPPYGGGTNIVNNPPPPGGGTNIVGNPPPNGGGTNNAGNPPPPPPPGGGTNTVNNPPPSGGGTNAVGNPPPPDGGGTNIVNNPPPSGGGTNIVGNPPPNGGGTNNAGDPPPPPPPAGGTNIVDNPPPLPPPGFQRVILLATATNAPADAMGRAGLDAPDADETNAPSLLVETIDLLAGSYTVSVADETRTNFTVLGTFDVADSTNQPGAEPPPGGPALVGTYGWGQFALPDGLDLTNVTTIAIADSNMVVDLIGDFSGPPQGPPCRFTASAIVTPGSTNAPVQGQGRLQLKTVKGAAHHKLLVVASGLAASQTYSLQVNGVSVGTTRSNRRGRLTITRLPHVNLAAVTSLEVDDSKSNVVFTVTF